jgi:hypothetical protein
MATAQNAREILAIVAEYGSIQGYLAPFQDAAAAAANLRRRFKFLGDTGVLPGALSTFAALLCGGARLRLYLRKRSRVLVNGMAGAGQHHLGSAEPHGRVVHVMSHRLAASLDCLHAMLQVPMYAQRIAHPILLVSRGSAMLRQQRCR